MKMRNRQNLGLKAPDNRNALPGTDVAVQDTCKRKCGAVPCRGLGIESAKSGLVVEMGGLSHV